MKNKKIWCVGILLLVCIIIYSLVIYDTNIETITTSPCPEGQYNSGGKCCPIDQVSINGNCMTRIVCGYDQYNSNGKCCPMTQVNIQGNCIPKIVCETGQYISNGKCCPLNQVNVQGNCMSKVDAENKYQRDISQLINIQYHKTDEELMQESEPTDVQFGTTYIYDQSGNKIPYPSSSVQGSIRYYTPGAYPYGTQNYVPNYEDSIYLSKLTGHSTVMPIYNTAKMLGGFCSYFQTQTPEKEKICNQLKPNECASTNCCVLLGGAKCIAGDANGPSLKSNYGDVFLRNKDFYYYQGKCYGNCQ